jgi:hypothetical protein
MKPSNSRFSSLTPRRNLIPKRLELFRAGAHS